MTFLLFLDVLNELGRWLLWAYISPPQDTLWELSISWLEQWQPLIAAFIALLGIPVSIQLVLWQHHTNQRRLRNAAVIRIPFAADKISSHARESLEIWGRQKQGEEYPGLPLAAYETLMAIAPDLDAQTMESVRQVVISGQVFGARIEEFNKAENRIPVSNIRSHILFYILLILYLSDRLFPYSRDRKSVEIEAEPLKYIAPDKAALLKKAWFQDANLKGERERQLLSEISTALDGWFPDKRRENAPRK